MMLFWTILSGLCVVASVALIDRAAINYAFGSPWRVKRTTSESANVLKPIAPEQICRKGVYIMRTVFYEDVLQMPTGQVQLFLVTDRVLNPPRYVIRENCSSNIALNEAELDPTLIPDADFGLVCYRDGLRFWYSELDKTLKTRYTLVEIIGLTFTGDDQPSKIDYSLVTPGLIDLLRDPSSLENNECVEVTESTSLCYRNTGQKCDEASSRCGVDNTWTVGCQCLKGYEKDYFGAPCLDIDECQTSVCNDSDTRCVNLPGSYHCEKLATLPPPPVSCTDDEFVVRTNASTLCIPKRVITPPELSCTVNRATVMKFLFFVGEEPGSLVMADADVKVDIVSKQTVNDKDRWTEQTLSLKCSSNPFTKMGTALLDDVRPYGMTDEVDIPNDLTYHILDRVEMSNKTLGGVNAECHSNGVLVWSFEGGQIYFIKMTSDNLTSGNINTTLKYSLSDDPRTASQVTCKKFGVADDCYWANSQRECDENKVCNATGQANDHFSVGCVCKPGFVGDSGDAPCSDTTLCIPGLKVERHKCVDIDECADNTTTCVEGDCNNVFGGYECRDREDCPYGTEYNNVTLSCVDIDECALGRDTCDPGSTNCVNIRGGFKCECKNPELRLGASLTTCVMPRYEFRLLDYNKLRCCSHRDGSGAGSAYLMRGRKGGSHSGYSEITPVACIQVTDVDLSRISWRTYTKPYILSGAGDLEVEQLLFLVDAVREERREPEAIAELLYPNGCRHAFLVGPVRNASYTPRKYYISYTPPSHNYFYPKDTSFSKCRRSLGSNVEWLSQNLQTPVPATMPTFSCHLSNNSGGRIVPLLVPTTLVLFLAPFRDVV